jgi:hypothetical protein
MRRLADHYSAVQDRKVYGTGVHARMRHTSVSAESQLWMSITIAIRCRPVPHNCEIEREKLHDFETRVGCWVVGCTEVSSGVWQ